MISAVIVVGGLRVSYGVHRSRSHIPNDSHHESRNSPSVTIRMWNDSKVPNQCDSY